MDIKEIQNLIKFVAKSGASEVKLEMGDFKITIKTNSDTNFNETTYIQNLPSQQVHNIPIQSEPNSSKEEESSKVDENSKYLTIKSPIIGTFYRKPSPDKDNYVEVGQTISVGSPVCVIEAMKLFNEIESEVSGRIIKVLVEDASPVEFDQPLFLVEPLL